MGRVTTGRKESGREQNCVYRHDLGMCSGSEDIAGIESSSSAIRDRLGLAPPGNSFNTAFEQVIDWETAVVHILLHRMLLIFPDKPLLP
jgi:hypothetical protein